MHQKETSKTATISYKYVKFNEWFISLHRKSSFCINIIIHKEIYYECDWTQNNHAEAKIKSHKVNFCIFQSSDVKRVLYKLNHMNIDGISVRICHSDMKMQKYIPRELNTFIVKKLLLEIDVSDFHSMLQQFAEIISCKSR